MNPEGLIENDITNTLYLTHAPKFTARRFLILHTLRFGIPKNTLQVLLQCDMRVECSALDLIDAKTSYICPGVFISDQKKFSVFVDSIPVLEYMRRTFKEELEAIGGDYYAEITAGLY